MNYTNTNWYNIICIAIFHLGTKLKDTVVLEYNRQNLSQLDCVVAMFVLYKHDQLKSIFIVELLHLHYMIRGGTTDLYKDLYIGQMGGASGSKLVFVGI